MSVSLWNYNEQCEGRPCVGDCDLCEEKEEKMRDCETCIYARPYGGANDNRCSAWSCEYINRQEAIEIWRANKGIVRCKDCKHYDTESRAFPCCTDIYGAVRYMEADGFCSKGERKGE